eukprot:m51a1_g989 hypothetical protein (2060) ;mRNA; r:485641-494465
MLSPRVGHAHASPTHASEAVQGRPLSRSDGAAPAAQAIVTVAPGDASEAFESRLSLHDPAVVVLDVVAVKRVRRPQLVAPHPSARGGQGAAQRSPPMPAVLDPALQVSLDSLCAELLLYRCRRPPLCAVPLEASADVEPDDVAKPPGKALPEGVDRVDPSWCSLDRPGPGDHPRGRDSLFTAQFPRQVLPRVYESPALPGQPAYPSPWAEKTRVLFEAVWVRFALADAEPLFCTAAVYELGSRTKASEDFFFGCNEGDARSMLEASGILADPETMQRRALFALPLSRQARFSRQPARRRLCCPLLTPLSALPAQGLNFWVFVTVYKSFQGDIEQVKDAYLRGDTSDPQKWRRIKQQVAADIAKYGGLKQYFCCAAFEVSDETGRIAFGEHTGQFMRADLEARDDVYAVLLDCRERKRTGAKQDAKKVFPSQWKFIISEPKVPQAAVCLDSMRRILLDVPCESFDDLWRGCKRDVPAYDPKQEHVCDLQQLPGPYDTAMDRYVVNLLFVYPQELRFDKSSKKSISVTVYQRSTDGPLEAQGGCEQSLFGTWMTGRFVASLQTAARYHARRHTFLEEVKVKMPLPVTSADHLLFVFRHHSAAEEHEHADSAAQTWFSETGCKDAFTVRVQVVSTVYQQDPVLTKLLLLLAPGCGAQQPQPLQQQQPPQQQQQQQQPTKIEEAINMLGILKPDVSSQNLATILRLMTVLFCCEAAPQNQLAAVKATLAFFESLATHYKAKGSRLAQLEQYLVYDLRNVNSRSDKTYRYEVFEGVASALSVYLRFAVQDPSGEERSLFTFAWFFFDAMLKSLALDLWAYGRLNDANRFRWLSADDRWLSFSKNLLVVARNYGTLIRLMLESGRIMIEANTTFAMFLRDLYSMYHRGAVVDMARSYIQGLQGRCGDEIQGCTFYLAFEFLAVFLDNEDMVGCNGPNVDLARLNKVIPLDESLCKTYAPMGLLFKVATEALQSPNTSVRLRALGLLLQVQIKMNADPRNTAPAAKTKIAQLFFPFAVQASQALTDQRLRKWKESAEETEKRLLSLLTAFVFKHIGSDWLQYWFGRDSSALTVTLAWISETSKTFEWRYLSSLSDSVEMARHVLWEMCISLCSEQLEKQAALASPRRLKFKSLTGSQLLAKEQQQQPEHAKAASQSSAIRKSVSGQELVAGRAGTALDAEAVGCEMALVCLDLLERIAVATYLAMFKGAHPLAFGPHIFCSLRAFCVSTGSAPQLAALWGVHSALLRLRLTESAALSLAPHRDVLSVLPAYLRGALVHEFVRLMNSKVDAVRTQAQATFYCMFRATGTIEAVALKLTTVVAQNIGTVALPSGGAPSESSRPACQQEFFDRSLRTLVHLAQHDSGIPVSGDAGDDGADGSGEEAGQRTAQAAQRAIAQRALEEWTDGCIEECLAASAAAAETTAEQRRAHDARVRELPAMQKAAEALAGSSALLEGQWDIAHAALLQVAATRKAEDLRAKLHEALRRLYAARLLAVSEAISALEKGAAHGSASVVAASGELAKLAAMQRMMAKWKVPCGEASGITCAELEARHRRLAASHRRTAHAPNYTRAAFAAAVSELSSRLLGVIKDRREINELAKRGADPDRIWELQWSVGFAYTSIPDFYVSWVHEAARGLREAGSLAEAAFCQLHAVKVIYDVVRPALPVALDLGLLYALCPSLAQVGAPQQAQPQQAQQPQPQQARQQQQQQQQGGAAAAAAGLTELDLLATVNAAAGLFKQAEFYEFAVAALKFVVPLLEHLGESAQLAAIYLRIHDMYKALGMREGARLVGNYYRVGFYGRAFEACDGAEYVYAERPGLHVFQLAEDLCRRFACRGAVTVLDATRETDGLDPARLYVQVTGVRPHFTADELQRRTNALLRGAVVKRFFYEVPVTQEGAAQQGEQPGLKGQWKRRVVLTTTDTLPSCTRRKRVMLSPLENAVEMVVKRDTELQQELARLRKEPNSFASLQPMLHILQGSVLPQVNGGMAEIVEAFLLERRAAAAEQRQQQVLLEELRALHESCREGVGALASVVRAEQAAGREAGDQAALLAELGKGVGALEASLARL